MGDDDLNFNEYQEVARSTAMYPDLGSNLVYPALKLAGEAGEVAEKIGKLMRDKGYQAGEQFSNAPYFNGVDERIAWEDSMVKELGDVLWYISALASELGVNLDYVAQTNLGKLKSRQERGVLGGSGDNR